MERRQMKEGYTKEYQTKKWKTDEPKKERAKVREVKLKDIKIKEPEIKEPKTKELKLKEQNNKANYIFLFFLAVMAIYYAYRMFALTPWYDELYTYYYFISRGPVYAAIHWPLPNNHVGYSVLSGILDFLGNSAIGLRGVSYLAALCNLVLLYQLGRRHFTQWFAFFLPVVYASMDLVNQLAVQGRGYTLAVTCFLMALNMLERICLDEEGRRKYYVIFALSLTLGLYILPSSVYWVVSLCISGGIYLLCRAFQEPRDKFQYRSSYIRTLIKLVAASLCAALMALFLYTLIWLAIGSNLLSKEAGSGFEGMSHVSIILSAPFQSALAGIEYMLATPYIQSVERTGYIGRLLEWFIVLFRQLGSSSIAAYGIAALLIAGIFIMIGRMVLSVEQEEYKESFLMIFLVCTIYAIPILLLIQCAIPYYRVFSYLGIMISILIVWIAQRVLSKFPFKQIAVVLILVLMLFIGTNLFTGVYHTQYSMREYYMEDALKRADINQDMKVSVTDYTSQYMIKYLYGIECENREIEGCELVLIDKKMADETFDGFEWEFYQYYDTIPWEYIEENMHSIYENDYFLLYQIK